MQKVTKYFVGIIKMTNFAARNERIDINQDSRDAQRPSRVP